MPSFIYYQGARPTIGPDRDEEPRAACADNVWPFDEMLEHRETSRYYRAARRMAADVCKDCPLFASCEFAVRRERAA